MRMRSNKDSSYIKYVENNKFIVAMELMYCQNMKDLKN
jgi:hypothetical protein